MKTSERFHKELGEQREWMRERGGDLLGYIVFYAQFGRPAEYARNVFNADNDYLLKLERRVRELQRGPYA